MYEGLDDLLTEFYNMKNRDEIVGGDQLIPCLIYVYTKAMVPEVLALLAIISNFTL